jgi:hypothetical protein
MCKSTCEAILASVVIILALAQMQSPQPWVLLVIVLAGLLSLVHSFGCETCFGGSSSSRASKKR